MGEQAYQGRFLRSRKRVSGAWMNRLVKGEENGCQKHAVHPSTALQVLSFLHIPAFLSVKWEFERAFPEWGRQWQAEHKQRVSTSIGVLGYYCSCTPHPHPQPHIEPTSCYLSLPALPHRGRGARSCQRSAGSCGL